MSRAGEIAYVNASSATEKVGRLSRKVNKLEDKIERHERIIDKLLVAIDKED